MEIIVGRDEKTRKLRVNVDGKQGLYGQPNCVPLEVSRQHLSLTDKGDGKWKIKNLNDQNVTYVNGVAIESKVVSEKDKIELGSSRYVLQWSLFSLPKIETVDIRPLKRVWDEYNEKNLEIQKNKKNIGLLASVPMGITMFGGFLSGIASNVPDLKPCAPYAYVFTAIALTIMVYGFYKRFNDNSIEEQEEIKKEFQRKYTCPKCGHFMGNEPYDILIQDKGCRHCKAKFKT